MTFVVYLSVVRLLFHLYRRLLSSVFWYKGARISVEVSSSTTCHDVGDRKFSETSWYAYVTPCIMEASGCYEMIVNF
jgi:hypothetical protein